MNKISTPHRSALILAALTMVVSVPAMARIDDHQSSSHAHQHAEHGKKLAVSKPHHAWKVGHKLPDNYLSKGYRVNYQTYHLGRPAKNQHWYRVNGDYVLVNVISHRILQVMAGR
jgi:Ni/Co efflux regulator RcnB